MAQGAHRAARRHRRAGDRTRAKKHRVFLGSESDRARCGRGLVRGCDGHRSRRDLHYLGGHLVKGDAPPGAFSLPDVPGVAVVPNLAEGTKCARSWKILTTIGADPEFPDVSPRDAKALREWETLRKAAE